MDLQRPLFEIGLAYHKSSWKHRDSPLPKVCKRWFPNRGSSLVWRETSCTPSWPQFNLCLTSTLPQHYLFFTLFQHLLSRQSRTTVVSTPTRQRFQIELSGITAIPAAISISSSQQIYTRCGFDFAGGLLGLREWRENLAGNLFWRLRLLLSLPS